MLPPSAPLKAKPDVEPASGVSAIHVPERKPIQAPRAGSGYLGVNLDKRGRPSVTREGNEPPVRIEVKFIHDVPGIWVREILPGSPASRSELRACDVIYRLNGTSVENDDVPTFARRLAAMKPGQTIALSVRPCTDDSPQKEHVVKITLGVRPGRTTRE